MNSTAKGKGQRLSGVSDGFCSLFLAESSFFVAGNLLDYFFGEKYVKLYRLDKVDAD